MEALKGIRVVELSIAVQGPAAGGFLSDMGADVIKVEPPMGDANRWYRGANNELPDESVGTQFIGASHGKRSVCVDIHTEIGLELVDQLVDTADVFLSNYREPALERIGMGYERLSKRNPGLVYATANGFGPDGPARENRMSDQFSQARSGIAGSDRHARRSAADPGRDHRRHRRRDGSEHGHPHRAGRAPARRSGPEGADFLLRRDDLDAGLGDQPHLGDGHLPTKDGAFHPVVSAMTGIYEASDGVAFCMGVREDEAWREFCEFGGNPELANDPRWNYREGRDPFRDQGAMDRVKEVRPFVAEMMKTRTSDEWQDFFDIHPDGITAQRVQNYEEVLNDEQALVNDYIVEKDIPHVGPPSRCWFTDPHEPNPGRAEEHVLRPGRAHVRADAGVGLRRRRDCGGGVASSAAVLARKPNKSAPAQAGPYCD